MHRNPLRNLIRAGAIATATAALTVVAPTTVSAQNAPVVDVTISSNNRVVTITGTSASESIAIGTIRTGSVLLSSDDDTRFSVNGEAPTSGALVGNPRVIRVVTRGGADSVRVEQIDVSRLAIRTGGGSDTVTIEANASANSARLFGGGGNDVLTRSGADLGDARVGGFETDDNQTPTPPPTGNQVPLTGAFNNSDVTSSETFVATPASFESSNPTIANFIAVPVSINGRVFPEDVIDLSAIDGDTTVAGNQPLRMVSSFTGNAGEVVVPTSNPAGDPQRPVSLLIDNDGDGQSDLRISFLGEARVNGAWSDNLILS